MIRIYQHGDHIEVAQIFSRAIHEIASQDYTTEQCNAWCRNSDINYDHWKKRCELKRPFIFTIDSEIAGFLELDPDGHIDCAYVNPDYKRRGVMTRLVEHAIQTAFDMSVPEVYVEASICIKPLFDKLHFELEAEQLVSIHGVDLQNYKMRLKNCRQSQLPQYSTLA